MNFRPLLALVILLVPFTSAYSTDKQTEGIALIQRAVDLTDLRKSGPYRLRASLSYDDVAVGKGEGINVVNFISVDRWRRDLQVTGYSEIALFLGGYMYRSRTARFTPPALRGDLVGSLRNLPEALNYKVFRTYDQKFHGVSARCAYLQQNRKERPAEIRWCFDPGTGLPVATLAANEIWYTEFSDYKPLGNKFLPSRIELFERGKSRGTAVIDSVETVVPHQDVIFKIPSDAIGRRWCDDMQGPRSRSIFPIPVPPGARAHSGLDAHYELTIDEHGRVLDVVPMAERPFIDRIAIETMSQWEFEPARCGDTPVLTDLAIDATRFMRQ
jgi:hypothetical protein